MVTGATDTFFELPADRWRQHGAMTGGCWLDDTVYFANNDTISRVGPGGVVEDVVTDLPWGDHMPSYPIVGPDGSLYFTVGSVTNAGVVGGDNYTFEWLRHSPEVCDMPGQDITLSGHNYEFKDVVGSLKDTVRSGAYVPFGTETEPGQVIPGQLKASGALLRLDPTTGSRSRGACATPTASTSTPTGAFSSPTTGSTSGGRGSSLGRLMSSMRSRTAPGTDGPITPRASALTTHVGRRRTGSGAGARRAARPAAVAVRDLRGPRRLERLRLLP